MPISLAEVALYLVQHINVDDNVQAFKIAQVSDLKLVKSIYSGEQQIAKFLMVTAIVITDDVIERKFYSVVAGPVNMGCTQWPDAKTAESHCYLMADDLQMHLTREVRRPN